MFKGWAGLDWVGELACLVRQSASSGPDQHNVNLLKKRANSNKLELSVLTSLIF